MQQPKIAEEIEEAVAQFLILIQTPPPLPHPLHKHSDLKIEAWDSFTVNAVNYVNSCCVVAGNH